MRLLLVRIEIFTDKNNMKNIFVPESGKAAAISIIPCYLYRYFWCEDWGESFQKLAKFQV
jgi:hypothetical protein